MSQELEKAHTLVTKYQQLYLRQELHLILSMRLKQVMEILESIQKNDCVIAISNSGETSELNNIIQFTKRFNITLISITSNPKEVILHRSATVGIL